MTREEYRRQKKLREREERRKRQEAWEAARGQIGRASCRERVF